jgi:hypothetical protein
MTAAKVLLSLSSQFANSRELAGPYLDSQNIFCEMSKCTLVRRQLNEASEFFAGKTETKQNEMTGKTILL